MTSEISELIQEYIPGKNKSVKKVTESLMTTSSLISYILE